MTDLSNAINALESGFYFVREPILDYDGYFLGIETDFYLRNRINGVPNYITAMEDERRFY